jgi:two-component system KDP operon response regulator KdpE
LSQEPKILLVEDQSAMRRFLRSALVTRGYQVIEAQTGTEGLQLAASYLPDLVLLDLGLPDIDGIEVVRRLREWAASPILILSARGQEGEKVQALDAGADDYLTKPFGLEELLARLRVAQRHAERHAQAASDGVIVAGALQIDIPRRRVHVNGEEVRLTPIEYKLVVTMARHAGRVLTHHQLLKEVWGPAKAGQTQYLHVYMGHLRAKLETDPARPKLLITEPGVGYRLNAG